MWRVPLYLLAGMLVSLSVIGIGALFGFRDWDVAWWSGAISGGFNVLAIQAAWGRR